MKNETMNFNLENFGKKSTFASFLPGIAGIKGIPIWCYYVNRGQGIVSFGVDNKDHAIMEFYPAHMAYQNVKRTGFRTFVRVNEKFQELFRDEDNSTLMTVSMNSLTLVEEDRSLGLKTKVTYFILPEEPLGALVRKVEIKNTGNEKIELELLDGMPEVIPYGVGLDSMKNMTQTAKAWMQVENSNLKAPLFRVRASMDDTASVTKIAGANFALGFDEEGDRLEVFVDPEAIFDYDNSLDKPVIFKEGGLKAVKGQKENYSNLLPSAFFARKSTLKAGEKISIYELYGQVKNEETLEKFLTRDFSESYFEEKLYRANSLIEELTDTVATKTGNEKFDAYSRYTYMDNVLRGGQPIKLGHNKIFYVYSRKHGDLERDYNYFAMSPEYYSQGNGNFRDVNQNRRLDNFFNPFVGRENIRFFYSLIQLDGYNPLAIEKLSYSVSEKNINDILEEQTEKNKELLKSFLAKSFTPGQLYSFLSEHFEESLSEKLFIEIMDFADKEINASFGEGYWSDHWDYNLDLVEEYLGVFPDKEEKLLFEKDYFYFNSNARINRRGRRYVKTEAGIRQYNAISSVENTLGKAVVDSRDGKAIFKTTLMEKLLLLSTIKFATLDPYGMGIEMEGGKPGWYDALNGMPGLLGSSMAETYELRRNLEYTLKSLRKYNRDIELLECLFDLMQKLINIIEDEEENLKNKNEVIDFWNKINDAKETYREGVYSDLNTKTVSVKGIELAAIIERFIEVVDLGILKAKKIDGYPTYFTYEVKSFIEKDGEIYPREFVVQSVPKFLEGPVRYLKLDKPIDEKRKLYKDIKSSDLFDDKLSMYKVNASLKNASFELGRALSFTPGWLENESIWLHMEYKYLLELIKSGMYEEYILDLKNCLVPFLDEGTYGRSVLENSSFIASSKNPNEKIHGKGFVARLSGSTIEFLNMWKLMMFGKNPFKFENERLIFGLSPLIPSYLIDDTKTISATMLGKTVVEYSLPDNKDFIPGDYEITSMELIYKNNTKAQVTSNYVEDRLAKDIRNGEVKSIKIKISRK